MTETTEAVPAVEQDNTAPKPKTIIETFSLIYTALDEAGKLAKDESLADKTTAIKSALDAIPQSEIDAMVQNIVITYKNLEMLHIIAVGFERQDDDNIRSLTTVQFGDAKVTLATPFSIDSAKQILAVLEKAITPVQQIILPD